MFQILSPIFYLLFAPGARAQSPMVWFYTTNAIFGGGSDVTINLKLDRNPGVIGSAFYTLLLKGTNFTTTNGVYGVRLLPADYTCSIVGIPQAFTLHVTNSTTDLNAAQLTTNLVRFYGVASVTGTGGITTTTDANGVVVVDGSGVAGGGGGSGNVTGPNASTIGELAYFDQITGQHLGRSGILYTSVSPWANWNTNAFSGSAFKPTNTFDLAGSWLAAEVAANAQFISSNTIYQAQFSAIQAQLIASNANYRATLAPTNVATASTVGLSKVDNSTITIQADGTISATTGGGGDFTGPGSSVADNFVSFNNTSGKVGKDSGKNAASFDLAGAATAATNLDVGLIDFRPNTNSSASGITVTNLGDGSNTNLLYSDKNGKVHQAHIGSGLTWTVGTETLSAPTGGIGTVTSVALAGPSDLTISGSPVTGSGTLTFARTVGASANFSGQNATNFGKAVATNQMGVVAAGNSVDPTNQFQVDTLAATKAFQVQSNSTTSIKKLVYASGQTPSSGGSYGDSGGTGNWHANAGLYDGDLTVSGNGNKLILDGSSGGSDGPWRLDTTRGNNTLYFVSPIDGDALVFETGGDIHPGSGFRFTQLNADELIGTIPHGALPSFAVTNDWKGTLNLHTIGLDQWICTTNAVNHAFWISNTTWGVSFIIPTNGPPLINGAAMVDFSALKTNAVMVTDGSANGASVTNAPGVLENPNGNGTVLRFTNAPTLNLANSSGLSGTNVVLDTATLAATSNGTNYTASLRSGLPGMQTIITDKTNVNLSLIGTNLADVGRTVFINNFTNLANCTVTFTFVAVTNANFSATVSNGFAGIFNFWNADTSGTNVIVSDAGRYHH